LQSFQIGDFIVHIDHGIGVFGGLVKTNINGKQQEAIKLIYKDNDVLFVSIHGIHRISRYKSKEASQPKVYKLGTGAWQKLKNQTKSKVKDIAKELIDLYSKRKNSDGFAFSPDTYLQHELEASFIYEDTPDQLKATIAIKEDMEKPYPMDRLICGDVGFGKTELAVRAAFKAVADSKQVAVLVPTTILALQHYKTFSSRLKNFPCRVEYISRLKTNKEIKEISSLLEQGKIDIIIGTHRLLNKEIKFKDLGILIIDEEQKFGVAAKERLRQLKLEIDTLTLSATPIPRTLQFSLLGARDLSIINTPPPNRQPVQTEIIDFNEEIISEAINYELERGGQIFFIHNRIEDIRAVEDIIRRIAPKAKTCVGHGQMEQGELEKIVLDFMMGDYDILVSTTIVENGIDIPNANTIFINSAQNFGLSDLHQLRGRVGRSNTKAFCYLIVPSMVSLTDEARRRLRAIETFSDLGSGFNIAMQDLDIRGAGNMLGGEQSGFIADMGFETYQRILAEAFVEINEERGILNSSTEENEKDIAYVTDCTIDTDLELLIPDSYISVSAEKIRLYKELDAIENDQDVDKFLEELSDRFGPVPVQVLELTKIVSLRKIAISLGIEKIVIKNDLMVAYFVSNTMSGYYKSKTFSAVMNYINKNGRRFSVKGSGEKFYITVSKIASVNNALKILSEMKCEVLK
jgi:transcription-repair coupling factor (superfamily II helicase)